MSYISRYRLFPVYHHFVVMDDVDHLDEKGIPQTADGKEVMVSEYHNDANSALKILKQEGWGSLLNNLAHFVLTPLYSKFIGGCRGVFLLRENLTPADRECIYENAKNYWKLIDRIMYFLQTANMLYGR
eukprot:UN31202